MNKSRLDSLRGRLEADRARLHAEISDLRDIAIKASTYLEDEPDAFDSSPADNASSMVGRQTDMMLMQNLELEQVAVKAALDRMDAGSYGTCDVCGKPIAEARLEARPAATTCIECQSAIESRRRREAVSE
jgi:RNA polymerase-binding protein DksA